MKLKKDKNPISIICYLFIDQFGTKFWYKGNNYHREDGPAIEYIDGIKRWYLNGINYTEERYNKEIAKRNLK